MTQAGMITDKKISKIVSQAIDADIRVKALVRVMKKYGIISEEDIKSSYRLLPLGNTKDAKMLKQFRIFRSSEGLMNDHTIETQIRMINEQIRCIVSLLEINGVFEKPKNFSDITTNNAVQRFREGKGMR